jgi:hypothetical protein
MSNETTETQQNQEIIVCLPKPSGKQTPEGYRPITLVNIDYKILGRIIAHRIRPVMEKLHGSQFCGVPNNIFDAVPTIREAIAQAEITATPSACSVWISGRLSIKSHTNTFSQSWESTL